MSSNGKRCRYTKDDVQNALISIRSGMSVKAASEKYNIPRSTLIAKRDKIYADKKPGPPTILSAYEESLLTKWIIERSSIAAPVTKGQLLNSVQQIVTNRENPFKNNRPGRQWYKGFMNRHSQLAERVVENLTHRRAQVSENDIREWFNEIETYITLNNVKDIEPNRIFNADETALLLNPRNNTAIVKKGSKNVYSRVNDNEKESITTLIMGNAAGDIVPPLILFGYQRMPGHIVRKIPKGWGIGVSDNGWMTGQNFFEYIANIFQPWLSKMGIQMPVILFIDGHVSHLTQPLSMFCVEHQIILIALRPNCTHILQPLDISMFRPLKNEYMKVVEKYKIENEQLSVQKEDFAYLLHQTLNNLNLKHILINGFRRCGLYPFNANAVDYSKLVTTKKNNVETVQRFNEQHENALKHIEDKISSDTLDSFRKCKSKIWNGKLEDKTLFELWWDLSNPNSDYLNRTKNSEIETNNTFQEAQKDGSVDEEMIPIIQETCVTDSLNMISLDIPIIFCNNSDTSTHATINNISAEITSSSIYDTINLDCADNMSSSLTVATVSQSEPNIEATVRTPMQDICNLSQVDERNGDTQPRVPSPFKKYLYWPKEKISTKKTTTKKEKLPSIVTGDLWLQYQNNKDEKKKKLEEEKEERKKIRLMKTQIKKEKIELDKKKKLEKKPKAKTGAKVKKENKKPISVNSNTLMI